MAELHKIWNEQCEAARGIEAQFGTPKALKYLVEEKFIDFLEAAEHNPDFRAELPAFVAEIRDIFDRWQLAECLETARMTELFDASIYEEEGYDPDDIEMERKTDLRRSAAELLLLEKAREWLLDYS